MRTGEFLKIAFVLIICWLYPQFLIFAFGWLYLKHKANSPDQEGEQGGLLSILAYVLCNLPQDESAKRWDHLGPYDGLDLAEAMLNPPPPGSLADSQLQDLLDDYLWYDDDDVGYKY
ncbi:hypothetical protein Q4485_12485 [Granulosicoccaceae sp. 1_MG-2023]|nr:hypothetical protein [Granulosicoccaceae sp. 1_MG-2023]